MKKKLQDYMKEQGRNFLLFSIKNLIFVSDKK